MSEWLAASGLTDEDLRNALQRALRLLGILAAVAAAVTWWKLGWRSAALLVVGAAISGSGLWEWLQLMTAVMERMDGGAKARPMGRVLAGFFLRLGVAVAVLYVSLKSLDGSVFALAAGLGLGIVCLTYEAFRVMKAWTV